MTSAAVSTFWSVWSWTTEMLIFFVAPLAALFFNVLVIVEVRRISKSSPSAAGLPRRSAQSSSRSLGLRTQGERSKTDEGAGSSGSGSSTATTVMLLSAKSPVIVNGSRERSRPVTLAEPSRTSRITTVMLLSVSFYVIATTLPATLVYVLESEFPEGDLTLNDLEIRKDATWTRFLGYILCRKVVEEICLSHYACNIVLYLLTGAHFRRALLEMLGCRKKRNYSKEYSEITVRAATPCTTAL